MQLDKVYAPQHFEPHWAQWWIDSGIFQASVKPGAKVFSLVIPPPNVTGVLHIGHMLEHTEIDVTVRWHRMLGENTLWLPGADHAGIATQMVVERKLAEEGIKRLDLGREEFEKRVWEWKAQYGDTIKRQMIRLGTSCDWSRERFTLDPGLSRAVREVFVRLFEKGLIYRGEYMVNWCPRCRTAISDLEVAHTEVEGHLWHLRYPVNGLPGRFIVVATTRPETMLGDTAVAINAKDQRYFEYHGKTAQLPLTNREIPIILDDMADPEFGAGAVKITPAHDPNDFEAGRRHDLPKIQVIDDTGAMTAQAGPYAGLDHFEARKRILADLETLGVLVKTEPYKLNLGRCDRCQTVVEPLISTQWFVKTKPLAEKAIEAVETGRIEFIPANWAKTYYEWMYNIRDWCISRQLWWGHRIPAWHCANCKQITVARQDPTRCAHCGSDQIAQETDVLDTWFSSGLLPVTVFGWPPPPGQSTPDLDAFYPTSLLVTGFDILFFWVARMIMLGCYFSGDILMPNGSRPPLSETVPFREVYIHALVRDADRQKMSKTKGNVVDPVQIVEKYGTDAVRFTLASMASPGTDIAFSEARTEGYRAFANKIWNAARFIFMNVERAREAGIEVDSSLLSKTPTVGANAPLEARWIVARLNSVAAEVNTALGTYRFDEAANLVYQFFWGDLCDWYLELVKLRIETAASEEDRIMPFLLFNGVFESSLRMLSPFMPFITEEIWHAFYDGRPPARSIALMPYPISAKGNIDEAAERDMTQLQSLIVAVRSARKDAGVPERESVPVLLRAADASVFQQNLATIQRLARVTTLEVVPQLPDGLAHRATPTFDVAVVYEKPVDANAERERLTKDLVKLQKEKENSDRQLGNESFLAKAPAQVVEGIRRRNSELTTLIERTRAALDALPRE